jgi:hypothetical protein
MAVHESYLRMNFFTACSCLDNVESLTSHNPTGLHGLLLGIVFFFLAAVNMYILQEDIIIIIWRAMGWIPGRVKILFFSAVSKQFLQLTHPPVQWIRGLFSWRGKVIVA